MMMMITVNLKLQTTFKTTKKFTGVATMSARIVGQCQRMVMIQAGSGRASKKHDSDSESVVSSGSKSLACYFDLVVFDVPADDVGDPAPLVSWENGNSSTLVSSAKAAPDESPSGGESSEAGCK